MHRRNTVFKRFFTLVALFGVVGGLAACQTWHGFGKDVEKAGEAIQKSGK